MIPWRDWDFELGHSLGIRHQDLVILRFRCYVRTVAIELEHDRDSHVEGGRGIGQTAPP